MKPVIEVAELKLELQGNRILEGIDFVLPRGAFLAVIGPNGAGKSFLVKLLLGLMPPTSGSIRIDGDPSRIGYVPQSKTFDRLFPARVEELVGSGLRQRWPIWMSASERLQVDEALASVGGENLKGKSIAGLSGGELQKVYLARSLVRKPDLMILDEPSTGVDFVSEEDLYAVLERMRRELNATVVMVTHDQDVAAHHATHVLLMNRKAIAFGAPADVMKDAHLREAFGHVAHTHEIRGGQP